MSELTDIQKAKIADLRMDPVFQSICAKLQPVRPRYKKDKSMDETKIVHHLIYGSGVFDGATNVLKQLGHDSDR